MARRNLSETPTKMANNLSNVELLSKGMGPEDVDFLANYLDASDLPRGDVGRLRRSVRQALDEAGVRYESKVRIGWSGAEADFMIGGVAIRCEDGGSLRGILGRVLRIAENRAVDGLILITTRNIELPSDLSGKPVIIIKPS